MTNTIKSKVMTIANNLVKQGAARSVYNCFAMSETVNAFFTCTKAAM